MAKLKNFTLEGEYFTLIAHLDFESRKPVIDLVPKHDLALMAMDAGGFDQIAEKISDDIYDLCRLYPSRTLIERFAKDWTEEAEECRDA